MVKPGLPRKYAKMGFKKGWREFKKARGKRTRSKPKSKPKKSRRARAKSATKGVTRRMGSFNTQKIFGWVRKFALIGPAVAVAVSPATAEEKVKQGLKMYTGFDTTTGQFDAGTMFETYKPYLFTALITQGIPKLIGIIRGL